jgi:hypothetical protein
VFSAPLVFDKKVALHYGLDHEILCFLALLEKLLLQIRQLLLGDSDQARLSIRDRCLLPHLQISVE